MSAFDVMGYGLAVVNTNVGDIPKIVHDVGEWILL